VSVKAALDGNDVADYRRAGDREAHVAKTVLVEDEAESPAPRKRGPKVDVELNRQRRADIMRAAAKLFDEVGYHGVNMETIAEAAGLKKPTLYHYVRSKDEILFQIHEAMIEALRSKIAERRDARLGPEAILHGVCIDIFEQMHDFPGYVRAFFEHMRDLDAERRAKIRKERNAYLAEVMNVIGEGMDAGLFRKADQRLTALALLGVCNWGYQWYRPKSDGPPREIAQKCWDIFSSGLFAR
jgi:TetR/AcrR family transcriptional regulator, cholesterol catabolism regulator